VPDILASAGGVTRHTSSGLRISRASTGSEEVVGDWRRSCWDLLGCLDDARGEEGFLREAAFLLGVKRVVDALRVAVGSYEGGHESGRRQRHSGAKKDWEEGPVRQETRQGSPSARKVFRLNRG
jgi:glutamate dehydrogenase/leucine dehydrogenase